MMDTLSLSRIDDDLDSFEVAALCFLCRDVLNRKQLEKVRDGRELFQRLQDKDLLKNSNFLSQLLMTIHRNDLLSHLETDSRKPEQESNLQTDSSPVLSQYRTLLYKVSEDLTQENLDKMKFLLSDKLAKGRLDKCSTALDVLSEMERQNCLSEQRLELLEETLMECDVQLALKIEQHRRGGLWPQETIPHSSQPSQESPSQTHPRDHLYTGEAALSRGDHLYTDEAALSRGDHLYTGEAALSRGDHLYTGEAALSRGDHLYTGEAALSRGDHLYTDARAESPSTQIGHYPLTHNPRGLCLIINNEYFLTNDLRDRPGTERDKCALRRVFSKLGFNVKELDNLKRAEMLKEVEDLGKQDHSNADALVVCVLSHGEIGCVFGVDGEKVPLRSLTLPFTGGHCRSLAGKPKLFFIQACQGAGYQRGMSPAVSPAETAEGQGVYESDAGPVRSIPTDADFLIGMATVEECKSFRNTKEGSIYIQELCRQLENAGTRGDDILTVMTYVNYEVSKGEYLSYKQMPEPKYTLTKKLVLPFI